MAINKRDLPLQVLEDCESLLNELRRLAGIYSDVIGVVEDKDALIRLVDLIDAKFYFRVFNPNQDSNYQTLFNLNFLPQQKRTLKNPASFNVQHKYLIEHFNNWIDLIKGYNNSHLNQEDFFTQHYQKEFYNELKIVDPDAETAPFEHHRQITMHKFLSEVIKELTKEDENNEQIKNLIIETENLKHNLSNLTKNGVMRKFTKIMAYLKKYGLGVFERIMGKVYIKGVDPSLYALGNFIDQDSTRTE